MKSINIYYTKQLCCLTTILFLTLIVITTAYAQGPCPGANCVSGDIKVNSVQLVNAAGQPIDFQALCSGGGYYY